MSDLNTGYAEDTDLADVVVHTAATQEEAEIVRAELEAAGIPAVLAVGSVSAGAGLIAERIGTGWTNSVTVPAQFADDARAFLSAPPPSEAELTALEEADPTTLAEAEARVKNL